MTLQAEHLSDDEAQSAVDDYRNGAGSEPDQKPPPPPPPPPPMPDLSGVEGDDDEKRKQADALVDLARRRAAEFFYTADSDDDELGAYADILDGKCRRTLALQSGAFVKWLRHEYYIMTSSAVRPDVIKMAIATLAATAEFDGKEREVSLRVAHDNDTGRIYIDLADDEWRVVEIRPDGWNIVQDSPVRFRRSAPMRPLPVPKRGGSFDQLRPFLNIRDPGDFMLICGWLCCSFRPGFPFPILVLQGQAGSAKSTATKVLRRLVDPNKADLRDPPHKIDDLLVTTLHNHVITVENASSITPSLSDALCRLATGAGSAKRGLYTNHDEVVINARRPIIMNGIEFSMRDDLADRAVFIELAPIPDTANIDEDAFNSAYEHARPHIFGAICDALSTGLRNIGGVNLERLPRMADFMKWGTACESDFAVNEGDFALAYYTNRESAVENVIEGDPVSAAVRELAYRLHEDGQESFVGSSTELLKRLEDFTDEKVRHSKSWPGTANALSRRLTRCAPTLRKAGVEVQKPKRLGRGRLIEVLSAPRPPEC